MMRVTGDLRGISCVNKKAIVSKYFEWKLNDKHVDEKIIIFITNEK